MKTNALPLTELTSGQKVIVNFARVEHVAVSDKSNHAAIQFEGGKAMIVRESIEQIYSMIEQHSKGDTLIEMLAMLVDIRNHTLMS
jgi:uncharacterized protein YlzI (FlbEa/FlbD family)